MEHAVAVPGRPGLVECEFDLIGSLVRTIDRLLRTGLAAFLTYPEALMTIVLNLPLVRGDKLSIRGNGEGEPRAYRLKLRKIGCSDRDRKLCARGVGDILFSIIFGKRPSIFRRKNLRDDHTAGLQGAATHWAVGPGGVPIRKIADKAATVT